MQQHGRVRRYVSSPTVYEMDSSDPTTQVQEVEDIPQDIDNRWDNAVGDVEGFGDRMDNAYDNGRDEQRYDDDRRDNW